VQHRDWRCNYPYKYAEASALSVVKDLRLNHNRAVAKAYVQTVADAVAAVVMVKEEQWSYQLPELSESDVTTIGIGIDGTCLLMCQDSWPEAMVGSISLYDKAGEREHIRLTSEQHRSMGRKPSLNEWQLRKPTVSATFPAAIKVGVADGAKTNWPILIKHCPCVKSLTFTMPPNI
jgi:hypothetical protein